jgi:pimeloyl-ACP methyl ester carboxylesterase
MSTRGTGATAATSTAERSGDYLQLGDLRMYYEVHGAGSPLLLLHGGMLTIDLAFRNLIPALAQQHQVIALEAQGHGRTNDTAREITPRALAGDAVALLDHLGVDRAHVFGHSMGAATALQLAVEHPTRVRSVVAASASVRPDGLHPDLVDPERQATSDRLPTAADFADMQEAYAHLSPHPEHFAEFLQTLSASQADAAGWTDEELSGITAPVLLVLGDRDFTTIAHGGVMLDLIPGSQLAVLPGTTHMEITRRSELLLPMLAAFLD